MTDGILRVSVNGSTLAGLRLTVSLLLSRVQGCKRSQGTLLDQETRLAGHRILLVNGILSFLVLVPRTTCLFSEVFILHYCWGFSLFCLQILIIEFPGKAYINIDRGTELS